jgi:hypothetical protein
VTTLHVTPEEYNLVQDWARLQEWEYVEKVTGRWPFLRNHFYENIEVKVVWPDMVATDGRWLRPLQLPRYRIVFASKS